MPVKVCPQCSATSHVRVLACKCGHQFRAAAPKQAYVKKGKKSFPSKDTIQNAINILEEKNSYATRKNLYKDLAATLGVKFSVLANKIGPMGLMMKTAPGALRGGEKLTRAEKLSEYQKTYDLIKKKMPEEYHADVDKAAEGSMRATIKINCLMCVGCDRESVRHCTATGCAWFPLRPYKTNEEK